jgi:hypothetical protein
MFDEELRNLCLAQNIIVMVKSRRTEQAGQVACMGR